MSNKTLKIKYILAVLAMMVACHSASADNDGIAQQHSIIIRNSDNYTTDKGLSSNNAQSVTIDDSGLLWIGTDDGVNSFDGYQFKIYRPNQDDTTSIHGKRICDVQEINENLIWMATSDGGVSEYDKRIDVFTDIHSVFNCERDDLYKAHGICRLGDCVYIAYERYIAKYNLITRTQKCIPLPQGRKYSGIKIDNMKMVPINDYTIAILYGKTTIYILNTAFESIRTMKFTDRYVHDICKKDENEMYVCSAKGLATYNLHTKVLRSEPAFDGEEIQAIGLDHSDGFWLAYNNNKLAKWSPDTRTKILVDNSLEFFNQQTFVYDILEDENGILWIATNNRGVLKLDTKHSKINNIHIESQLPDNYITESIWAENDSSVWAACGTNGILHINPKYSTSSIIPIPHRNVYSICIRQNGEMYLGTTTGLIKRDDKKKEGYVDIDFPKAMTDTLERVIINHMCEDCLGNIWLATQIGLFRYNGIDITYLPDACNGVENVNTVFEDSDGRIWCGTNSGSFVKETTNEFFEQTKAYEINKGSNNNTLSFAEFGNRILIGTTAGVLVYNKETHRVQPAVFNDYFGNTPIYSIVCDDYGIIWLSTNNGVGYYDNNYKQTYLFDHSDGLTYYGNECRKFSMFNNKIYFGHATELNVINVNMTRINNRPPKTFVSDVTYGQSGEQERAKMQNDSTFAVKFLMKATLRIKVASSDFTMPQRNEFMYKVDNGNWTHLQNTNEIILSGFMPGNYTISLRSTNSDKIWTYNVTKIYIYIAPPLWGSKAAILFYIIVLISITWFLLDIRFRGMKKKMKQMETEARAKKVVEAQRNRLAKIHKDQTDSINYAKRIQRSLMPGENEVNSRFNKFFVYYKPKDIVSGDFYCFYQRDGKTFIVAADCTGHGVPGAFLSIIGINQLNNIIMKRYEDDAGRILTLLHREMHNTIFKSESDYEEFNEGMDLTICVVDYKNMRINFAGAMNDLYIIRDNEITTVRGDRQSIGTNVSLDHNAQTPEYTSHDVECRSGDMFYMFSDGYVDQFGGPEQKKFKHRRFKHLLMNIHKLPARDQKIILNQKHEEWKGNNEQTDDISIIGFEPWV